MCGLARKGFFCGGPPPYGYDIVIVDKNNGASLRRIRFIRRMKTFFDGHREPAIHQILDLDGNLQREVKSSTQHSFPLKSEGEVSRLALGDPARVEIVKLIFQSAAEGRGLKTITKMLNARRIPAPSGWGLWAVNTVKAIFDNPIYRGMLEWNSRTESKYTLLQDGNMVPKPRSAKGQVIEHEERDRIQVDVPELAIIPSELWHRAHAIRAARRGIDRRKADGLHSRAPLGGKILCGDCGGTMYRHSTQRKKRVGGEMKAYRFSYYMCSTYLRSGSDQCGCNKVNAAAMEEFVFRQIREALTPLLFSRDMEGAIRAMLDRTYGTKNKTSASELMKRYTTMKDQVDVLERLDTAARTKINMEAAYHEMKEQLAQISKQLEPQTGNPAVDIERHVKEIMHRVETLKDFDKLSPERQKSFFGQFVERIKLRFRRVRRGKGWTSRIQDGTLDLRLWLGAKENRGSIAEAPVVLLGSSGGPLQPSRKLTLDFGPADFLT